MHPLIIIQKKNVITEAETQRDVLYRAQPGKLQCNTYQ